MLVPTLLSTKATTELLSFIEADDHDDWDEDFNDFVTTLNLKESSEGMELLQTELDRARTTNDSQFGKRWKRCLKLMRRLNRRYGVLPPSMILDGLVCESKRAVKGGGFSDVYIGRWYDRRVCMKVLRYFQEGSERETLLKALSKEVLLWRQLNHPNILPFLGVNTEMFAPTFCIISPWLFNGDIISYTQKHPLDLDMKLKHAAQVAEGLVYLHGLDPPVAHGDIKGANILIYDDRRSCCLADFGLSVLDTQSMNPTKTTSTQGSLRWLAPEFINPPSYTVAGAGMLLPRDIYAFGCTVVEILTGTPPFSDVPQDIIVAMKVLGGERPSLPIEAIPQESVFKSMYSILEWCWSERNSERPSAQRILDLITNPQDLSLLGSVQVSKNTDEEHGSVVATGFAHGPARSASQPPFSFGSPQQRQPHRSSPHIFTAYLHNPEALPSKVPAVTQTPPPEPPSYEESIDELDFNQPSTLQIYTQVVLFKNDPTRTEMVCSTPTPEEYHVVKLIAQKLALYHYSLGKKSTIVTRIDTQSGRIVSESQTLAESALLPFESVYQAQFHDYTVGGNLYSILGEAEDDGGGNFVQYYIGGAGGGGEGDGVVINSSIGHRPAGVIERDSLPWDDPLLNHAWRDYQERIGQ
ncbi:kinase-like domain-containing protein [Rhodocollybia butyracea]|uniref:Kinase-like domain-containing protein n=1 Tax=Rhodocollybia butyracea TaxID=206335 RepID=A0A9P5Q0A0_9AGAR|nr:kinase-like domain-containing protein [Rhodocollybia butyracea]